jgi:hypothetical protein
MALHKIVFYSPDRRWRISANERGTRFTVERDLIFQTRVSSLPELEAFLRKQGIELADLIQD